ncbi:hypothetical protein LTR36_001128 [Oleoguttula mirabilis]|uniref:Kelch repeat protein n=1 Tax=Oleoguttula mirabilis TaxID=1507867 RepID=A0AAV9JPI2_9PEZI|nr:hypothetical protein LTR36_001128 [Oleoguttula mirabilis]
MASISGTWTKLAAAEQLQRSSHTVSAVGSSLYVFGGELKPRQPKDNDVHVVDIDAASKKPTAKVASHQYRDGPSARVGSASTGLGSKVYFFSGRGGEAMAPVDEEGHLWELEPSTSRWTLLAPLSDAHPAARSYHAMTSDGKDTIFLHAGCPEQGRLGDLWSFDLATKQWRERKAAPEPQRGGTSIAFTAGKLYRMGGFDGKTEQGGSLDIYDPNTDDWSTLHYNADGKSGPGARSVAALLPIAIDGKQHLVSMFGESDPSSLGHQGAGNMLGDVWAWSIDDEMWRPICASNMPAPRGWFDADVVTLDGKQSIVVVGGLAHSNDRLDDAWLLSF